VRGPAASSWKIKGKNALPHDPHARPGKKALHRVKKGGGKPPQNKAPPASDKERGGGG